MCIGGMIIYMENNAEKGVITFWCIPRKELISKEFK